MKTLKIATKQIKKTDWIKMLIWEGPTREHGLIRLDLDGRKWEWIGGGLRIHVREYR